MNILNELVELAKLANIAGQGSPEMVDFRVTANPDTILAIAEAFRALEQRADVNMAAAQAMRDDMYHWKQRAEEAEAKLAASTVVKEVWKYRAWTAEEKLKAQVPDGWKLVPVEPDWEMLSADGCKEHHNGQPCLHHDNRKRIWSAMLAAAPNLPQ